MTTTLKHIKFDEEDLQAVEQVQRLYGCENFSQAVRLAVRLAARHARTEVALPSLSKHTTVRKPQSVLGIIQLPPEVDPDEMDKAIPGSRDRMIAAAALKMSAPLITVDQQIIASGAVEVLE